MFGSVKWAKNDADTDKSSHSGNGIGFHSRSLFSIPNFDWGKNGFFLVDMSSFVHIDNRRKDIVIFGKGQTRELMVLHLQPKQNILLIFQDHKENFV